MKKLFKLRRKDIVFVQFIIEGYDGMATVTTMNAQEAIIQFQIMPDFCEEIFSIIEDLKNKYHMEAIIVCTD